ncbi:MAG: hypothetical protein LBM17_09990 [Candidatus Accumulibacter sp.]|jgi:hypothetical protein|nr:hypothetical protein [Accumulibacter sp.]
MRNYSYNVYSLSIHEDAERDLDALWEEDEESVAIIEMFLEEVEGSQELLERFTDNSYADHLHDPGFDIKRWRVMWKDYPLWRLRLFNVPMGAALRRIVYTFHPKERRYYVLGIVPRDFDYDPSHPLSKRIVRVCAELGLS